MVHWTLRTLLIILLGIFTSIFDLNVQVFLSLIILLSYLEFRLKNKSKDLNSKESLKGDDGY